MQLAEHSLALLGVVLLVGLFIPALLERFRIPFASSLILVGALVGPHGMGYVEADSSLTLFAFLGATFHMLLAGFEAHELDLRLVDKKNTLLFTFNGLLPAGAGAALGFGLGYSWQGALLTATIFMSSSILLVFGFVRHFKLDDEELGQRLKASVVLQDLTSTVIAFVLLKSVTPHERFPLPILVGLVVGSVATLRMYVPEVVAFAFSRIRAEGQAANEQRVRFVLALMLLVLFLYAALDVPAVVAAFLVGFALASIDEAQELRDRLHLIAYALFIPVFLFTVGLDTNIAGVLGKAPGSVHVLAILAAAILTKLVGGIAGARLVGFDGRDSWLFGLGSSVKLAVPITATYAALKMDIIGPELYTAVVLLSATTALVLPLLWEFALREREEEEEGEDDYDDDEEEES